GSGRQARAQAIAIAASRPLRRVLVHSPNPEHRESFARDIGDQIGAPVEPLAAANARGSAADIVSTATPAIEPGLAAGAVRPGLHVNAIGAHYPDRRELDGAVIARARLFADDLARSRLEDGELQLAIAEGSAAEAPHVESLAAVAAGRATGRRESDEVTV